MYILPQSIQLIKKNLNICLEKDFKNIKQKFSHMTNTQISQHIMKYNFPSSFQSSPKWHKSQLQDLLTMIEKFGMPHFLKTLIAYEMTSLKWHEFNDMEYIIKQIHPNMSWKDYPIECVTLFHSRVNMFVYKHILNNDNILSKVKKYVIHYELQHHGFVHAHIILWVQEENFK
jgi:hypothetical protein